MLLKLILQFFRWTALSAMCGVLSGLAAAVFLLSLDQVTALREHFPELLWGLPFAGLLSGLIYHHWGQVAGQGQALIIDEIHDPKNILPVRMAPMVLGGTILSHLFGASAGREGAAVQTSASLSDQLARFFHLRSEDRKILLVAGTGAGFGAAVGAPWAGMIFGMEVISIGKMNFFALYECFIASFVAEAVTEALGASHPLYPPFAINFFDPESLILVVFAGILFGLAARTFTAITHWVETTNEKWIKYPPLRPFVAGLILILGYHLAETTRFAGLGTPIIENSMLNPMSFADPFLKGLFTAITVGGGFKGGEFVPLVFIGSTLGSALSIFSPTSVQLLAAVGFAAVFAGASNTPITSTLMAIELFGLHIGPYAFIACFMSYFFSGYKGIYKGQKIVRKKPERIYQLAKKIYPHK